MARLSTRTFPARAAADIQPCRADHGDFILALIQGPCPAGSLSGGPEDRPSGSTGRRTPNDRLREPVCPIVACGCRARVAHDPRSAPVGHHAQWPASCGSAPLVSRGCRGNGAWLRGGFLEIRSLARLVRPPATIAIRAACCYLRGRKGDGGLFWRDECARLLEADSETELSIVSRHARTKTCGCGLVRFTRP